jgi:hypothetical protein
MTFPCGARQPLASSTARHASLNAVFDTATKLEPDPGQGRHPLEKIREIREIRVPIAMSLR